MNIKYYRKCKNIERLQGAFKHRTYNLMEHQWGVAMLFRHFASVEDIAYDINVLDMVLHHDILEVETTDLLYPIKNLNNKTKEAWGVIEGEVIKNHFQLDRYSDKNIKETLTESQFNLFKVCDLLDLWIFAKEEQAIGNSSISIYEVIQNCEQLILGKYKMVDKFIKGYEF